MRILALSLLMLTPISVAAATIGEFTDVQGDVRVLRAESYLAAAPGVDVDEEDIIETGTNASAQVELRDGSLLRLGAESQLLMAEYKTGSDGNVIRASLEVMSGWLRFAVSKLHRDDGQYNISTPTMTIGIRGTEGVIDAQNTRAGLLLEEGEVAVSAANTAGRSVRAGEYIERTPGQAFTRPGPAPSTFKSRLPKNLQARMARRAQLLMQHGVHPRLIRKVQPADRERYLRQSPHLHQKLEQRFRRKPAAGADAGRKTVGQPQAPLRHTNRPGQGAAPAHPKVDKQKPSADKRREKKKKKPRKHDQQDQAVDQPSGSVRDFSVLVPA